MGQEDAWYVEGRVFNGVGEVGDLGEWTVLGGMKLECGLGGGGWCVCVVVVMGLGGRWGSRGGWGGGGGWRDCEEGDDGERVGDMRGGRNVVGMMMMVVVVMVGW